MDYKRPSSTTNVRTYLQTPNTHAFDKVSITSPTPPPPKKKNNNNNNRNHYRSSPPASSNCLEREDIFLKSLKNRGHCESIRFIYHPYCITGEKKSYQLKYLDSVVITVRHNYSSITKICCKHWVMKLSRLAAFFSKHCYKLSAQFEHLDSVIP